MVQTPAAGGQDQGQNIMQAIQDMYQRAASNATSGGPAATPTYTPGSVAPLTPINFNPTGAPGAPISVARPAALPPPVQTGSQSIGAFGNKREAVNAGLVSLGNSLSSLFGRAEQKEHDKKAAMAENYMMQINSLLASGNPQDREKAQTFMDDPKIRKVLKDGLNWQPLTEPAPPEAVGVHTAVNKIAQGAQAQPPPGGRAVMPQASLASQIQASIQNAVLQDLKNNPEKALKMAGSDTLSAAETRTSDLIQHGFQLSPAQTQAMSLQEKFRAMHVYETIMKDTLKMQVDMYRAGMAKDIAHGHDVAHVQAADVAASARKYSADKLADSVTYRTDHAGNKKFDPNATAAKYYAGVAKTYHDMAEKGKDQQGRPLDDKTKKYYEDQAKVYEQKGDDLFDQSTLDQTIEDMIKLDSGEGPDADTPDDDTSKP